jgi:hypothetical protein
MQTNKITAISDVDDIMAGIVMSTPNEVPLRASTMASEVSATLAQQYGSDASKVRYMLTIRKLEDMARGHLRRTFDPDKTAEDAQLAFTEFGDDVQNRYPIKVSEGGVLISEYQSPMYAPVDQLREIADREIEVGSTRVRRGHALHAFIDAYRADENGH